MSAGPWAVLGIEATADKGAIRRAYADRLKAMDIDRDVEGYAALRAARGAALAQAKRLDAAPVAGEPALEDDAGGLRFEDGPIGARWDDQEDMPLLVAEAETGGVEAVESAPQGPTPPGILYDLLFPNGEYCADGFDYDDQQAALGAVHAIVDDAQASAVDRERAIEEWLAHQLATAWPRSAYLVDPAAERFRWAGTAGQLTEIPAVRFLNERLRGMRFVDTVSQPSSPLHKAWVELSREGPRNALSRFRARPADVKALLAGVREHYPEVESYLDPVRVASWERSQEAKGCGASSASIFGAIFAVAVLRAVISAVQSDHQVEENRQRVEAVQQSEAEGKRKAEELVRDLFGTMTAKSRLPELAPDLDKAVFTYRSMAAVNDPKLVVREIEIRNLLRMMALRAAASAPFEDLVAIKQVQLELMKLALAQGGADMCSQVIKGTFLEHDLNIPATLREKERALYLRLLEKKMLSAKAVDFPKAAPIPGEVVKEVMNQTRLDRAALERAVQGNAPPSQQCAYQIALLEAVLKRPSSVSISLLRMI